MAIPVKCRCGKKIAVKDEAAGRRVKCPQCQKPVLVPEPADEDDAAEDEWDDAGQDQGESVDDERTSSWKRKGRSSRRKQRPAGAARSKGAGDASQQGLLASLREIVAAATTAFAEASSQRKLVLAIGAMIGLGFVGFIAWTFFLTTALHLMLVPLALVSLLCSPLLMFVLTDAYYRRWIRTEIESLGGTLQRIRWRPFQGSFFTRGWKLGRSCRFYQVTFQDRQGRQRTELCGINVIRGAVWGDDIDEMQFIPILDARLEKWGLWAAITSGVALTTFFAINESAYALLGHQQDAQVTESQQAEFRGQGRIPKPIVPRFHTLVQYEWVGPGGVTHQGRHLFDGAVSLRTVTIEYLPGGHGVRVAGPSFGKSWLRVCSYLALFFTLLYALDYFDVFGVHAAQRRRAAAELR